MTKEFELPERLSAIRNMSLQELQDFYLVHWKRHIHCRSKVMLRKRISFELQVEQHGGYSEFLKQQVEDIGLGKPQIMNLKGILTGTVFTRVWQGKTYRLMAVEDGFMLNGQKYGSLSGAAMAVTGSQWSGKLFWKVK